jgi:radical SAM protein with 4Fe4S-binding SPASM domain
MAYWPVVGMLASELGLPSFAADALQDPEAQARFLTALAERLPEARAFRPATIGFRSTRRDIRQREVERVRRRRVTFLGRCPREVVLGALEVSTQGLRAAATVSVQFKGWDCLAEWAQGSERICDVCGFLFQTRRCGGEVMVFSSLQQVPDELAEFLYERPRVRVGWLATDLVNCADAADLTRHAENSVPFGNLREIAKTGVWPHVILPVSAANVTLLPELVSLLVDGTRGGTVELVPVPLVSVEAAVAAPAAEDYVAALLAIGREGRIPSRLISPPAWVMNRIESEVPLVDGPAALGADFAVLPDGSLYACESTVGIERWCLGNVSAGSGVIRWELLDIMPEMFSKGMKPEVCQGCDWRHRCGGVDPEVVLLHERGDQPLVDQWPLMFRLYCEPRRALFEEMLLGRVDAAAQSRASGPRELLELQADGLVFKRAAMAAAAGSR